MGLLDLSWQSIAVYIAIYLFSKWVQPKLMPNIPQKGPVRIVDRASGGGAGVDDGVEPVPTDFDWRTTEPHKYRPFKPVYHMTMGITRTSRTDLLRIDCDYEKETNVHEKLLEEHPDELCYASKSPATIKAVGELYDYIVSTALQRYPQYFVATGDVVGNLIKNTEMPRKAAPSKLSANELLRLLKINFVEDFLLMEFDPKEDEYVLRAMTGTAANGFAWHNKVDRKLTDVHLPVPNYKDKLQSSMNRYFKKIEPGQFIQRITWGIQTNKNHYQPTGLHLAPGEAPPPPPTADELDFSVVNMRTERQVLTKLAQSKFVLFSLHTYMYPLADIKKEGLAEQMAKQIEAWPEDYAQYKSRPRWGAAVLEYLRSDKI